MSISSDEVNYLIYRYLIEQGYTHSSFAFQYESTIHLQDRNQIQNGLLIQLVQKGLLFNQIETHLQEDGTERKCIAPFTLLGTHTCQYEKKKRIDNRNITVLQGHDDQVFCASWGPLLATGSGDGSARIWDDGCIILSHEKDVTSMDWSGDILGTACYDGIARLWTRQGITYLQGILKHSLQKHKGPIFALKFNKKGDLLVTAGVDMSCIVWDLNGNLRQVFTFHKGPCLDIDWRDDLVFASCGADHLIHICQLGTLQPLKTLQGHKDEINSIKWSPDGQYLVSSSDDKSTKVWSMDGLVLDLTDEGKEMYSVVWIPDGSIRVWDLKGNSVHHLHQHTEAVYSLSTTPDGLYLASGSFDKSVCVWQLSVIGFNKDGKMVREFRGDGGVFEIKYNPKGDTLVVCSSDKKVVCLNMGAELAE